MSDAQVADARRTPEYKDYVHGMLGPRIKAGVEQAMAGQLVGTRPVRLRLSSGNSIFPRSPSGC